MKKLTYIISGVILFSLLSFAQSITVRNPANGDVWVKNDPHVIEWRASGEMNESVKIRLFNGNGTVRIKSITNNTPASNGSFRCPPNFFNDVPDGLYTIKIRTIDNNVTGNSNVFSIGPPPTIVNTPPGTELPENQRIPSSPSFGKLIKNPTKLITKFKGNVKLPSPSIKTTFPPKDHNWRLKLGNTSLPFPIRIMWLKTGVGHQDLSVSIYLKRVLNGVQTTILTRSTPNDGLWRGEISRDLLTSLYTIIIQTLDGNIRVESDPFYITNAANDPH